MTEGFPCAGKRVYWTKGEAKRAARAHAALLKTKRNRAYHCEHCGLYHLTSRNGKSLRWHQKHPGLQQNPIAIESLRKRRGE